MAEPAYSESHFLSFWDGPLAGVRFPSPDLPEKVVLQLGNGRTYRYECDVIDQEGPLSTCRMVLTRNQEAFDEELKGDEK